MNRLTRAARKLEAMIFPWPAKHEREAAIARARHDKEQAQAQANQAGAVSKQIRRMADENHFAQRIADQIMRGYR